jgi:hypothetical protein
MVNFNQTVFFKLSNYNNEKLKEKINTSFNTASNFKELKSALEALNEKAKDVFWIDRRKFISILQNCHLANAKEIAKIQALGIKVFLKIGSSNEDKKNIRLFRKNQEIAQDPKLFMKQIVFDLERFQNNEFNKNCNEILPKYYALIGDLTSEEDKRLIDAMLDAYPIEQVVNHKEEVLELARYVRQQDGTDWVKNALSSKSLQGKPLSERDRIFFESTYKKAKECVVEHIAAFGLDENLTKQQKEELAENLLHFYTNKPPPNTSANLFSAINMTMSVIGWPSIHTLLQLIRKMQSAQYPDRGMHSEANCDALHIGKILKNIAKLPLKQDRIAVVELARKLLPNILSNDDPFLIERAMNILCLLKQIGGGTEKGEAAITQAKSLCSLVHDKTMKTQIEQILADISSILSEKQLEISFLSTIEKLQSSSESAVMMKILETIGWVQCRSRSEAEQVVEASKLILDDLAVKSTITLRDVSKCIEEVSKLPTTQRETLGWEAMSFMGHFQNVSTRLQLLKLFCSGGIIDLKSIERNLKKLISFMPEGDSNLSFQDAHVHRIVDKIAHLDPWVRNEMTDFTASMIEGSTYDAKDLALALSSCSRLIRNGATKEDMKWVKDTMALIPEIKEKIRFLRMIAKIFRKGQTEQSNLVKRTIKVIDGIIQDPVPSMDLTQVVRHLESNPSLSSLVACLPLACEIMRKYGREDLSPEDLIWFFQNHCSPKLIDMIMLNLSNCTSTEDLLDAVRQPEFWLNLPYRLSTLTPPEKNRLIDILKKMKWNNCFDKVYFTRLAAWNTRFIQFAVDIDRIDLVADLFSMPKGLSWCLMNVDMINSFYPSILQAYPLFTKDSLTTDGLIRSVHCGIMYPHLKPIESLILLGFDSSSLTQLPATIRVSFLGQNGLDQNGLSRHFFSTLFTGLGPKIKKNGFPKWSSVNGYSPEQIYGAIARTFLYFLHNTTPYPIGPFFSERVYETMLSFTKQEAENPLQAILPLRQMELYFTLHPEYKPREKKDQALPKGNEFLSKVYALFQCKTQEEVTKNIEFLTSVYKDSLLIEELPKDFVDVSGNFSAEKIFLQYDKFIEQFYSVFGPEFIHDGLLPVHRMTQILMTEPIWNEIRKLPMASTALTNHIQGAFTQELLKKSIIFDSEVSDELRDVFNTWIDTASVEELKTFIFHVTGSYSLSDELPITIMLGTKENIKTYTCSGFIELPLNCTVEGIQAFLATLDSPQGERFDMK